MVISEQVLCVREPLNESDRYAVAIIKDEIVISHLLKNISRLCSLFIYTKKGQHFMHSD